MNVTLPSSGTSQQAHSLVAIWGGCWGSHFQCENVSCQHGVAPGTSGCQRRRRLQTICGPSGQGKLLYGKASPYLTLPYLTLPYRPSCLLFGYTLGDPSWGQTNGSRRTRLWLSANGAQGSGRKIHWKIKRGEGPEGKAYLDLVTLTPNRPHPNLEWSVWRPARSHLNT